MKIEGYFIYVEDNFRYEFVQTNTKHKNNKVSVPVESKELENLKIIGTLQENPELLL